MKIIVFLGPTLPADVARDLLPGAEIRPPAGCGDIYRAGLERPSIIGLVDGYFDHRLSVWHKEITWGLQRGIVVYGAASMGALRAAELESFGMVGVGWVFEQFRTRQLEDDDEVAIAHEPPDQGYRVRSDAMVNLRVTLRRAAESKLITESSRDRLIEHLKKQFYPRRSRQGLCVLSRQLLESDEAGRFVRWLDEVGVVDQKQQDAREMLGRIAEDARSGKLAHARGRGGPFCHTNAWQALVESVAREPGGVDARASRESGDGDGDAGVRLPVTQPPASLEVELSALLAGLKERCADRYLGLIAEALERALAVTLADASDTTVDLDAAQRESERFRRQRGLLGPSETARWLSDAHMDLIGFSSLINDNVLVRQLAPELRGALLKQLRDVVRIHGLTGELAQAAAWP